jgi:ATP synthase protein I
MSHDDKNSHHKTLEELSRKVNAAIKANEPVVRDNYNNSGMGIGMRMASEFVSAILVGALLGFGLDNWLKTAPWLLLFGLGIGFAAGVVNIIRAGEEYSKNQPLGQDLPPSSDDKDD